MPAFEREQIERMLRKLYPHLWLTLTKADVDAHRLECAALLLETQKHPRPKELTKMVKRFRKTFSDETEH